MRKKRTIEEVSKIFESRGYKLLESEYISCHTPMKYICPNHPESVQLIRLTNLLSGQSCTECAEENRRNTRRKSIIEVKKIFSEHGYELLEEKYVNGSTPMKYRCPNHPDKNTKMSLDNLIKGNGCPYCYGNAKYTINEVRQIFSERGYELIDSEYKDIKTLMRYRCPSHPDKDLKISLSNLKNHGAGCPYCARTVTHTYEEVIQNFHKRGYKLISKEYIKARLLLDYVCNKHPDHIQKITYNSLLCGHGCAYCAGNVKYTYDEVKKMFSEKEYNLITKEYINSKTPMQYICKKHPMHIQEITLGSLRAGHGCQDCWGGRNSKLSQEVENKLIDNDIVFLKEYRFKDCRLKIMLAFDFYLPHHNICIEVDGQQHFKPVTFGGISEDKAKKEFKKIIKRDKVKNIYCKNKGIRLIRIPYFDIGKVEKIINEIKIEALAE